MISKVISAKDAEDMGEAIMVLVDVDAASKSWGHCEYQRVWQMFGGYFNPWPRVPNVTGGAV